MQIEVRIEKAANVSRNNVDVKSKRATRKGMKDNFLTLKFKISSLHIRAGTIPDFNLFVKDNLHDPSAPHPAAHAGNFMTFTSGNVCDRFFSGGILYNPNEKEVDMKEDRQLAANQALQSKAAKPLSDRNINKSKVEVEEAKQSSSSESSSDKSSSSEVSDSDVNPEEVYDMLEPARRVSFKPPARSNEESDISSFGDHKYGRGAERQVTAGKKKKRTERKKRAKLTVADIKTDILDNHHVQLAGNRVEHKGATRGRARGGKGGTRSKRGRK